MPTFLRVTLILWRTQLVRLVLTKRLAIVFLGCLVPPAISLFLLEVPSRGPTPIEVFLYPSWFLTLQLMVPLASVIIGSAVISEEVDDRTITYLFSRPIPRATVLIGRWLAGATVLLVLVAASVGAVGAIVGQHAKSYVPPGPETHEIPARGDRPARTYTDEGPRKELVEATKDGMPEGLVSSVLAISVLGALAYSALFAAISTFAKYPMIIGLAYCIAIEGFLAALPGTSQSWTIQYYLRSFVLSKHAAVWKLAEDIEIATPTSASQAVTTLIVVLVIALAAGSVVVSRKQYVLSA